MKGAIYDRKQTLSASVHRIRITLTYPMVDEVRRSDCEHRRINGAASRVTYNRVYRDNIHTIDGRLDRRALTESRTGREKVAKGASES